MSEEHLNRKLFVGEYVDKDHKIDGGVRERTEKEYVAVERDVQLKEHVTQVPVVREVKEFEPQWQVQTITHKIPREKVHYEDRVTPITHKRVIDEFYEEPVEAGTETKFVPRVQVQERDVELTIPRIKWKTKETVVPEVREIVRYIEADHNVERVIRYMPETPPGDETDKKSDVSGMSPQTSRSPSMSSYGKSKSGRVPGFKDMSSRSFRGSVSSLQGMVMPRGSEGPGGIRAPVTVDIPVPFMVPKPVSIPIEVPVMKFRDQFVPVPIRRHITPRLSFTGDVYDVPCVRERPILVVEDVLKPVPVDAHIRVVEKDVRPVTLDPMEFSQADMQAMWMRVNADLLETFKQDHGGKYPRGMGGKEESEMVPAQWDDWETALQQQEDNEKMAGGPDDGENVDGGSEPKRDPKNDLGPIPLHTGHPLMMTMLQTQWCQNPTDTTHGMYTPEFFREHYAAINAMEDPRPNAVCLSEDQTLALGPEPNELLPNPWKVINLLKDTEKLKHSQI